MFVYNFYIPCITNSQSKFRSISNVFCSRFKTSWFIYLICHFLHNKTNQCIIKQGCWCFYSYNITVLQNFYTNYSYMVFWQIVFQLDPLRRESNRSNKWVFLTSHDTKITYFTKFSTCFIFIRNVHMLLNFGAMLKMIF